MTLLKDDFKMTFWQVVGYSVLCSLAIDIVFIVILMPLQIGFAWYNGKIPLPSTGQWLELAYRSLFLVLPFSAVLSVFLVPAYYLEKYSHTKKSKPLTAERVIQSSEKMPEWATFAESSKAGWVKFRRFLMIAAVGVFIALGLMAIFLL